jgi:glycerate-2-kinase
LPSSGGRLAEAAYPASLVSLVLSDVVGDPLPSIASGPTVADAADSTFEESLRICRRYPGLLEALPAPVRERLAAGAAGAPGSAETPEDTPAETPKVLSHEKAEPPSHPDSAAAVGLVEVIGSNRLAVAMAKAEAERLGYHTLVLSTLVEGEAREVASVYAAIAKQVKLTGEPVPTPACIIAGGETTVTLRGSGLGGRNQELAVAAARCIQGVDGIVVLSGGTDGSDGPTDAAGGAVDGRTLEQAAAKGWCADATIERSDSYHFLQAVTRPVGEGGRGEGGGGGGGGGGTAGLVTTGPTGTNVMDVALILVS